MIAEIAERLLLAQRILFITGAGISADSGLPTYRGVGGLYDAEATSEGVPIEVALSGQMLQQRPELTWKYLAQIEAHCRGARPNAAHEYIAEIGARLAGALVFTQNVDGLHTAAGSPRVIEIHGNLQTLRCDRCGWHRHVRDFADLTIPPHCPRCRAMLRPDVVLFGEALPGERLAQLEDEMSEGFDLVFSIGTSSLFPYIVEPVLWARDCGIPTIEINPGSTAISDLVDYRVQAGAADAMSAIRMAAEALS